MTPHKYQLLHLKADKMRELSFLPYNEEKFDLNNYKVVYEGQIESDCSTIEILEHLYERFNISKPADYNGHSLSVSDVVVLDNVAYYCDSFGWERIKKTISHV